MKQHIKTSFVLAAGILCFQPLCSHATPLAIKPACPPQVPTKIESQTNFDLSADTSQTGRIIPKLKDSSSKPEPLYFYYSKGGNLLDSSTGSEVKRSTLLYTDLHNIFDGLRKDYIPSPAALLAAEPCGQYFPTEIRSTLTVTLDYGDPAAPEVKNADGTVKTPAKVAVVKNTYKKEYIYGPEENWYLAFDVPVSSTKQLKYDQSTGQVVEANTPSSLYLSPSYKLGDVYIDYYSRSDWWLGFSGKVLFQASSHPLSSTGLGVGYAFKPFDLFVARVSTVADSSVSPSSSGRTWSNIIGLSFNTSTGVKWLTGK